MFVLKLYDREGNELNEGDFVKISNGRNFSFYSEVKYLEDENLIAPFHTFSFHSFVKVNKIPEDCELSKENSKYKIWIPVKNEKDDNPEQGNKYLCDWMKIEALLEKKYFRVKKINQQTKLF